MRQADIGMYRPVGTKHNLRRSRLRLLSIRMTFVPVSSQNLIAAQSDAAQSDSGSGP